MKYKIIYPWLDIETNIVHPVGELVEMNDKKRADNLVKLGAFEEYVEDVKEEVKKPKTTSKTTSSKKKK